MLDPPSIELTVIGPSDDDLDAACEAVANGLRGVLLVEHDDPNDRLTLRFTLEPDPDA